MQSTFLVMLYKGYRDSYIPKVILHKDIIRIENRNYKKIKQFSLYCSQKRLCEIKLGFSSRSFRLSFSTPSALCENSQFYYTFTAKEFNIRKEKRETQR